MNIASVFQGIASIAWIGFIGVLVLAVTRASRQQPTRGLSTAVIALAVVALVMTAAGLGMVFLQADQYGVVISAFQPNGYRPEPLGPGLHLIIPGIESVQVYSVARQTYTMSSSPSEGQITGDDSIEARTKDGQQVYIDASLIYAIDPAQLINLHRIWQSRFQDNVVRPVTRAAIRDAVSQFGVEEIVSTKRNELEKMITDAIQKGLTDNNLIMSSFLLRNIRFSDQYAQAVEQKQIAEQQAGQTGRRAKEAGSRTGAAGGAGRGRRGSDSCQRCRRRAHPAGAGRSASQHPVDAIAHAGAFAISIHHQAGTNRADHLHTERQSIHFAAA
ncbi:MAG: prohibitin family protein [Chloroflexi bacterium]|nr:prohibitin family protein [Chloroflexota bacterium]